MSGYTTPQKLVKSPADVKAWESSQAYVDYLTFIDSVCEAVSGKKVPKDDKEASETVTKLLGMISKLDEKADKVEPAEQQQRFGNKAFRTWYEELEKDADSLLEPVLQPDHLDALVELKTYLLDSFGNSTRIDYGTGHEMAFVMLLCGLFKIGVLTDKDREQVGLLVFSKYLELCRKLQLRYRMEPAGSQGVWNLDDHQFVPFIWGAAQLTKNARIKPKSIPDYDMANMLGRENLLFGCVGHINKVKTGPFAEHSNQLWNISAVQGWEKVCRGLIKMYRAEVLAKFPVVQHVYFGKLFKLEKSDNPMPEVILAPRGQPTAPLGLGGMVPPLSRFPTAGGMPPPSGRFPDPEAVRMPPPTLGLSDSQSSSNSKP